MYDSTNWQAIPADAQMVAGYIDGPYAWPADAWLRFRSVPHVYITIDTHDIGNVLDVENGDATPAMAVGWVQLRRAAGTDPTVYCSESVWQTVRDQFTASGVAEPHYWIAWYNTPATLDDVPGAVAKQYANSQTSGGDYDLSIVADYWPGVDPVPDPAYKEVDVATGTNITVVRGNGRDDYYYTDSSGNVWHEWPYQDAQGNPQTGKELINNGYPVASTLDGYYLSNLAYTFIKARTMDGKTFTAKQADSGNSWDVTVS